MRLVIAGALWCCRNIGALFNGADNPAISLAWRAYRVAIFLSLWWRDL